MNEIHDCRKCKNYGTDYDCRENCEGRDMFEPIKKKPMKLIIELEKIKADLLNLEFNFHYDWATTKHIIEIIDNHISELKGE